MKPVTDGVENKKAHDIDEFEIFISNESEYVGKNITYNVTSFHEYIHCVEILQENSHSRMPLIFRGHNDMEYKLRPCLMRHNFNAKEIVECEIELMKESRNRGRRFVDISSYWEWHALAQHHLLPTRLLDWTYRAGTALFFAIEEMELDDCAGVWAISAPPKADIKRIKPWDVTSVQLYNPPHIDARISAQQSCFTVHPNDYCTNSNHLNWIQGPRVILCISKEYKNKVLENMSAVGIHRAALFPDLDGVASHLERIIFQKKIKTISI